MHDEEDEYIKHLVDIGYFKREYDELGRVGYRPTDKMYQEHPEMGQAFDSMIGNTLYSLWEKGFVEIEILDNGMNVYPLPDPSKFDEIDSLDEIERDILKLIQRHVSEEENG